MERHCPNRTVLGISGRNGAFAEYLTLPIANLHPVPDCVNDRSAVFTELIAAALEIHEQAKIKPDQSVLVIGDGKLGILICRILQICGCEVTSVGSVQSKLQILARWGIKTFHRNESHSVLYDMVVEASGSASGFAMAAAAVKPRGTLILKSTYAGHLELDASPFVINEITVIGSRCGPFPPALRLLEKGLIYTEDLITQVYPISDAMAAFQHAAERESLKILINFT
jgi:threonine dehydrogenase-like Zn-dependent dehydrogenase